MGIQTIKLHMKEAMDNAEKYMTLCKKKNNEIDYAYTSGKIAAYKEIWNDIQKEWYR